MLIRNDCDLDTDSARLIYVHIELQQPGELGEENEERPLDGEDVCLEVVLPKDLNPCHV